MAYEPDQPNNHPAPPIKDRHHRHRHTLDAQDLLKQLTLEEKHPDGAQKAHNILEYLALPQIIDICNKNIADGMDKKTVYEQAAIYFKDHIEGLASQVSVFAHVMPDAKAMLAYRTRQACNSNGHSPDLTPHHIANAMDFIDFALTFKATFPKGAELKAEDMPLLFSHFEQSAPTTPAIVKIKGKAL